PSTRLVYAGHAADSSRWTCAQISSQTCASPESPDSTASMALSFPMTSLTASEANLLAHALTICCSMRLTCPLRPCLYQASRKTSLLGQHLQDHQRKRPALGLVIQHFQRQFLVVGHGIEHCVEYALGEQAVHHLLDRVVVHLGHHIL